MGRIKAFAKENKNNQELAFYTQWWRNYLPYDLREFNIKDAIYFEQTGHGKSWFDGCYNNRKIIHRLVEGMFVGQGNHDLFSREGKLTNIKTSSIEIYHYPIRTYKQFKEKVIGGGKAFLNSKAPCNVGWHWRSWYEKYNKGDLYDIYIRYMANYNNLKDKLMTGEIKSERIPIS